MTRILVLTTIERTHQAFLIPFAERIKREGWVVDAAADNFDINSESSKVYDNTYKIPWSRSLKHISKVISSITKLRRLLLKNKYDIIHTHTPIASIVSRIAAATLKKSIRPKVIYTSHGFHFHPNGDFLKNKIYYTIEKFFARFTDIIITINTIDYDAAKTFKTIKGANIIFMKGIGVDLTKYHSDSSIVTTKDKIFTFIVVAEFIPRKRHIDIIKAAKICDDNGVRFHIDFLGDGILLDEIIALAIKEKLIDRFTFHGHINNVKNIMSSSDALILSSSQEGLPRCILEAMAMGIPVIASDIRGNNDLISEGAGTLYHMGNIEDLAYNMLLYINKEIDLDSIVNKAEEEIKKYSISIILDQYIDLLYSVKSEDKRGNNP
jgi:glycosyltransferase involved in cell wall biosynthesis